MKIKKVFGDDKRMSLENESRAKKKHWSPASIITADSLQVFKTRINSLPFNRKRVIKKGLEIWFI